MMLDPNGRPRRALAGNLYTHAQVFLFISKFQNINIYRRSKCKECKEQV